MNFQKPITPSIVIADQPTESDLIGLKAAGYVAVVNLRNDGEPEQPIDTVAEGELLAGLGLAYIHMGVGGAPLQADRVEAVCDFIDAHAEGKVLVHCRKGGRAAAIVLLQQARHNGWSAGEATAKGKEIGLEVDGNLRLMAESYLANRPQS
jgi:uncharacterized protein (TIGR01244 family)